MIFLPQRFAKEIEIDFGVTMNQQSSWQAPPVGLSLRTFAFFAVQKGAANE